MEPASKLQIIGVMGVVVILLMIGLTKEDSPFGKQTYLEEGTTWQENHQVQESEIEQYEPELVTPMYYLVVGSFIEESNAKEFYHQMSEQGYETYSLPPTDGYIRIGIFASPYKEDVLEYKKTIYKDISKSWITYQ